jgi:hypothetical protein
MDKIMTSESTKNTKSVCWSKRVTNEDGSSIDTKVEKVDGGYVITKETEGKNSEGEWEYKTEKSISQVNPFEESEEEEEEKSLIEKLKDYLS